MKANKLFGIVTLMLLTMFAVAGAVSALPSVDKVEVDGTTVFENQINRLSLENGNTFAVNVWLTSTEAADNVRVEAQITGYEHGSISDTSDLFATQENTTYKKSLSLSLPADAQSDSYQLRITVTDRNSGAVVQDYSLVLDQPRHDVIVKDVVFSPEGSVIAGQALLTSVRVQNFGQKDETNVRVHVSIPELGVSATSYISKVRGDNHQEDTEEMYIRIPSDVKTGDYQVKVDVSYNDDHDSASATRAVSIEAAPVKAAPAPVVVTTTPVASTPAPAEKSTLRSVLEGILLVLVGLLVIVAIILGVSKLSSKDE
jgi:uncharacterized membrane protein